MNYLEEHIQVCHRVIGSFRVFDSDIGHHLGERLQQLDKGQVVFPAKCFGRVARQNAHDRTEVVLKAGQKNTALKTPSSWGGGGPEDVLNSDIKSMADGSDGRAVDCRSKGPGLKPR